MKRILILGLLGAFAFANIAIASESGPKQDHTCQGGHNCNGGAGGGDASANAGAVSVAGANASAGASALNSTQVSVGQNTSVGVGVKNENTNLNSDFNSNTNVAHGGRGGDANQIQGQHQGQSQGQQQGQSQNASANNEGNSQTVNFSSPDSVELRQTVSSYAPPIYSSNACTLGGSFGGSNLLGSISIGGTKIDKSCAARENARIIAGMGFSELALVYLCKNAEVDVGETLGELCKVPEAPPVVTPLPPVVTPLPEPEPPVVVVDEKVKG